MAISGGFAGGLAQGLRNGMVLNDYFDRQQDRKEQRAVSEAQARAMQEQEAQAQGPGLVDLAGVQAAPSEDLGQSVGLTPVEASAGGAQPQGAAPASAQGGLRDVTANYALPQQAAGRPQQNRPGQDQDISRAISSFSAGISEAWKQKRPDLALDLMVRRERLAAANRGRAYDEAFSRYSLNGDPKTFIPFVNNYLNAGIEIDDIKQVGESKDGMPIYELSGTDLTTGKPLSRAMSAGMLNSYIQGVRDPQTQQAMFAQTAEAAFKARQALQEHQRKIDLERSKPRSLGENDTLVDGFGNVIAQGPGVAGGRSRKDEKALLDRNKGLASYVFKLNGVDSMQGLADDRRKSVADTIALGENINKLNSDLGALGDANVAQLAQNVISGQATVQPVRVNGGVGYATEFQGEQILIPPTAIPMSIRQQYERSTEGNSRGEPAASEARVPAKTDHKKSTSQTDRPNQSNASDRPTGDDSPAGKELDAARAEVRQAREKVRQLRQSGPGLKAVNRDPAKKEEFDAQLAEAENALAAAEKKERAARAAWDKANRNNPANSAFTGR